MGSADVTTCTSPANPAEDGFITATKKQRDIMSVKSPVKKQNRVII
jgi:hypothetical protein